MRPTADPARRALLHAAWAAPSIVVVSAVPSYAASVPGTPPAVSVTVSSIRGFDGTLRVTNTIRNTGQTPTTALRLLTTIAATSGSIGTTVVVEDQPWTADASGGTPTNRTVSLVKDNGVIAAGGSITLSFRIGVTRANGLPITGTLTTMPTATPGQATPGAAPITDA